MKAFFLSLSLLVILPLFSYAESADIKNEPFYFIRHAETHLNHSGTISGQSNDISINKTGEQQVLDAANILRNNNNITIIVASPMVRTQKTAQILSEELNIPIVYHEGLKEANWGVLEGQQLAEVQDRMNLWFQGHDIDKAENIKDFRIRVKNTINEILEKYDNPLIVSHGAFYGVLRELVGMEYVRGKNATPYKFIPVAPGKWEVETIILNN